MHDILRYKLRFKSVLFVCLFVCLFVLVQSIFGIFASYR